MSKTNRTKRLTAKGHPPQPVSLPVRQRMRQQDRVIVSMPLAELWEGEGTLNATKARSQLTMDAIKTLLTEGPVRIVVADVGLPLEWVDGIGRYQFVREEVKPHLCITERWHLEDFPGGYCYVASEWDLDDGGKVVLLEKSH